MIDVLAFAPHPDDVELYCSGTLARLKKEGYKIGIVDLTRGELSSRGTLRTRQKETEKASKILHVDVRENLGMIDGNIECNTVSRMKIIDVLRRLRPKTVFIPYRKDRHPDHERASKLIRESIFYSGLSKIVTPHYKPHRPIKIFYYMLAYSFKPSFIVDISDTFDTRLQAINAYSTQFNSLSDDDGPQTYVSTEQFMEFIIARAQHLGFQIGTKYGEGFKALEPVNMPTKGLV